MGILMQNVPDISFRKLRIFIDYSDYQENMSPKILFCLEYRGQSYGKLANHLIHDIHLWLLLWYHGEKHVKMSHKLCSRQLYWCLWNHLWLCCVPLFVQLEHMLQNVIQITSMQGMKYYFCTNIRSMLLYFIKCSSANCTW